jgi:hypothetical protein
MQREDETMVIRHIAGDEENVLVVIKCVSCDKVHEVKAPVAGLIARENGALIQVAFPRMSAGERELFVSGICDDCFPKAPEEDDEDEEDADPAAELNADEIEGDKMDDDPSNWY